MKIFFALVLQNSIINLQTTGFKSFYSKKIELKKINVMRGSSSSSKAFA
jgi:predicted ATPase